MEANIYYAEADGVALERRIRKGHFDMRVKHFHNQYEIFYLLEGERKFFFDNRSYIVHGGTLILVDENAIHMTASSAVEEIGHDRIILYVDRNKIKEYDERYPHLHLVRFFREHYGVYPLTGKQQQDFIRLYLDLQEEFDQRDRCYKTMIDMTIIMYFIHFMRETHRPALVNTDSEHEARFRNIYAVADYISENFDKPISLEALSEQFYISKCHLSRTFKEITGYGITEYINIHRIQKAKRLLEETDLSIQEVAHALGYESMTYFEKVFKNYMALSPLKYRKTLDTVNCANVPET